MPPQLLPQEFLQTPASSTPEAVAVVMGDRTLSYADLNAKSNQLAHFFGQHGIQAGNVVGVYLDRSIELLVAILGILKSGAVYLPLDPKLPPNRLAFILRDASPSLILTQRSNRATLPETSVRIIVVDESKNELTNLLTTNFRATRRPDDLAYLMYTSGSTGQPKGVMIPSRALSNLLSSMAQIPGMSPTDVLLATTTISFDISILELLLPLVTGGRLVVATWQQATDPAELGRLLKEHNVTIMQATPTTWRMLVDNGWKGKSDLKILCGGEVLPVDLAGQLLPRCRELWNMYGPTETTIWSATQRVTSTDQISLGAPIANTQFYVVDQVLQPIRVGSSGELLIGGEGLAMGYVNQPELTASRFIPDHLSAKDPRSRLYRTGDEVRVRPDGSLEFIGRLDSQVKLHGFRIELGDVESSLTNIPGIRQAVVALREVAPNEKRLIAYYTGGDDLAPNSLSQTLKLALPEYMIPSVYVHVEKLPLTFNGKIDRNALPLPCHERPHLAQTYIAPSSELEKRLAQLWCEVLQLDRIGIDDNFFDLGGTSIEAARMVALYDERFGRKISTVSAFQYLTIAELSRFLQRPESAPEPAPAAVDELPARCHTRHNGDVTSQRVAIIGMVGRFPGANDLAHLWHNLTHSVESISFFTPEELGPGIDESLRKDPDYIRARGILEGAELFDASYFGISPLEASVMDPQQRVFLELAQHALETAGYDPARYKGRIGIFAGIGDNHYFSTNLLTHPDLLATVGRHAVECGNEKDYIALRVAYLLDLRGPAVSLNTACSTSLLTIDEAYNNLLNFECDMALAGGIDICVPQKSGFLYQEGATFAKDGHCRPFDADATGTMFCDGAGIVVLKRLSDAIADHDTIYAVLCGSAKNNNGGRPASFLAPSVDGQADAIAMAQARAGVPVETIRYVEGHGTGTPVGDPIEFEALCKAFRARTDRKHFCYLGSIKGNIGHPTNAAGVAGLIKAALVLHHEEIPPTHHFKKPNPKIDLEDSPFQIADRLIPLPRTDEIRRSAVSSFGFGGTNVHMILEEAPLPFPSTASRPMQLLLLSGRTNSVLSSYARSLAQHLSSSSNDAFADTAYTLQLGRKQMAERKFVVASDSQDAVRLLTQPNPLRCASKRCERRGNPPIVFMFGGQGTQYVNMGHNLYTGEPLFRSVVDHCCEILKPHLGCDLRELLYPVAGDEQAACVSLQDTYFTQPAIFVMQYALAQLWSSLGVRPSVMVGHSIGEFVAATLAGVWDLEDALRIIAVRGRLMQSLPRGSMLAVGTAAENLEAELPPSVQIASINAPFSCVVSGPEPDILALQASLEARNLVCRQLHTSHAFHSAMMDPIVEPLRAEVAKTNLSGLQIPFVSTVTGQPITAAETTDPSYWARHARSTVRFANAVRYLLDQHHDLFLECGPRATLCSLVRQQRTAEQPCQAIPAGSDTPEHNSEWAALLFAIGSLWLNGVTIDWDAFYAHEQRRRIPLPTYPFERQRYWVDSAPSVSASTSSVLAPAISPWKVTDQWTRPGDAPQTAVASAQTRKQILEVRLKNIIAPISGRDPSETSASATLLEQGFDSISLVQVAFAIRREFGVKLTFRQLMHEYPNLEMLAAHLEQAISADQSTDSSTSSESAAPKSTPQASSERNAAVPSEQLATLSPTVSSQSASVENSNANTIVMTLPQRGIYASSQLSAQLSASYNESVTLHLWGQISISKSIRALQRLVDRHDALRASFDDHGEVMTLAPKLTISVPTTSLASYADAEQHSRLTDLIAQETAAPFPLPAGPLFRAQIILLSPQSAAIVITAHHVICDGWSLDVLIHDFCAFYSEELSAKPVSLDAPRSYFEYLRSVNARVSSPDYQEARDYWHKKFADGFPVLVLPTDHARVSKRDFTAERVDHPFPKQLVADLRALATDEHCSFFAVVLGGLSILLARASQQDRFVLALPFADQPTIGQPGLVGHCVTLLPFLAEFRESESVSSFLNRVQTQIAEIHDHRSFNLLDLLLDLHRVTPAKGISPTSVGLTNIKRFEPHALPQSGFALTYDSNPKAFDSFEFYLNAVESSDHLEIQSHFNTALFDEPTIERRLATLQWIFSAMVSNPAGVAAALAEFPVPDQRPSPVYYVFRSERAADAVLQSSLAG